jgi:hypothetical protein
LNSSRNRLRLENQQRDFFRWLINLIITCVRKCWPLLDTNIFNNENRVYLFLGLNTYLFQVLYNLYFLPLQFHFLSNLIHVVYEKTEMVPLSDFPSKTNVHPRFFCHVVVWMLLEMMCKELGSGLQIFRYPMTWVDVSFGQKIRRRYNFRLFIYHRYQIW